MASEMVDRVARALSARRFAIEGPAYDGRYEAWRYRDLARDLIQVMADPTEAMIDDACHGRYGRYSISRVDAERVWRLMIIAALRDPPFDDVDGILLEAG